MDFENIKDINTHLQDDLRSINGEQALSYFLEDENTKFQLRNRFESNLKDHVVTSRAVSQSQMYKHFLSLFKSGAEDDDIDVIVAEASSQFICPLTKEIMSNPYKNTNCPHSFEYSAILEYVTREGRSGICPQVGCNQKISKSSLIPNTEMLEHISALQEHSAIRNAALSQTQ